MAVEGGRDREPGGLVPVEDRFVAGAGNAVRALVGVLVAALFSSSDSRTVPAAAWPGGAARQNARFQTLAIAYSVSRLVSMPAGDQR